MAAAVDHHAVAVDDQDTGRTPDAVVVGHEVAEREHHEVVTQFIDHGDGIAVVLEVDGKHLDAVLGIVVDDLVEVRHDGLAIGAPGCPEQQDAGVALRVLREGNLGPVIGLHRPCRRGHACDDLLRHGGTGEYR